LLVQQPVQRNGSLAGDDPLAGTWQGQAIAAGQRQVQLFAQRIQQLILG